LLRNNNRKTRASQCTWDNLLKIAQAELLLAATILGFSWRETYNPCYNFG